jgi:hypothetical protein
MYLSLVACPVVQFAVSAGFFRTLSFPWPWLVALLLNSPGWITRLLISTSYGVVTDSSLHLALTAAKHARSSSMRKTRI